MKTSLSGRNMSYVFSESLVVSTGEVNANLERAARNISFVELTTSDTLNTYDVLRPDKLLFTKSAFEKVEARLTKE